MKALVKRLDHWLRQHRPDYHASLHPGLKVREIRAFEDGLGFRLPQPWKDLYAWRNGQHDPNSLDANGRVDTTPGRAFQQNRVFDPLHVVQREHALLKELLEGGTFDKKNWWNVRWVPVLTSLSGDHLCVDLEGTFRGRPGQVLYFCHDAASRVIEYPCLEAWLETFVVSMEAGMWQEQDGCLQPTDQRKWHALVRKLNPGYPKYKHAG